MTDRHEVSVNSYISIVMPAFNEGARMYANLLTTDDVMGALGVDYEIILVDDGSLDDTYSEAKRAAAQRTSIRAERVAMNQGKGHALKHGAERARGDVIVFLDADLDLDPRQLSGLLNLLERCQADVVIGSKHHPDSRLNYPRRRRVISIGYKLLLLILFRLPIEDTQTGLKVFRRAVLERVYPRAVVKGFASDVELLAVAHRLGYRIVEAPVVIDFRREQRWGKIRVRDIVSTGVATFAIFGRMFILRRYEERRRDISTRQRLDRRRASLWEMMSSRLARIASMLFGASMIGNIANYLFQMFAGRTLGASDYGALNALLSVLVISGVGGNVLLQMVARYSSKFRAENRLPLAGAFLRRTLWTLLAFGSMFFVVFIISAPKFQAYFHMPARAPIVFVGATLVLGMASNACMGALLGTERFGWYSVLTTLGITRAIAGVVLIGLGFGVAGGVAAGLIATLVTLIVSLFPLHKLLQTGRRVALPPGEGILGYGKSVLIAGITFTCLNSMDVILARHYLPATEAGYYAAASVLGKIALYLPASVVLALFPMVSLADARRDETRSLLTRALALTALGSISVAVTFMLVPHVVLSLLLGTAFTPAAGLLRLYGIAMVPLAFANLLINFNLARHDVGFVYWLLPIVAVQYLFIMLFHNTGMQIVQATMLASVACLVATATSVRTRPMSIDLNFAPTPAVRGIGKVQEQL